MKNIADQYFAQGTHTVDYGASLLSEGVYLVELKSRSLKVAKRVVVAY